MQAPFSSDDLQRAEALAGRVSLGSECAELQGKGDELFHAAFTKLAKAVAIRDEYTGNHSARVAEYSHRLAKEMMLPPDDLRLIRFGAALHDLGKIGIPDSILRKPAKLTAEEFAIMETHTVKGVKIVELIGGLAAVIPILRSHHERWDGLGYPDKLAGEEIPLFARIVAVANAFDAMTSDRPYCRARSAEWAFEEIKNQSGRQFDPKVAEAFLRIREDISRAAFQWSKNPPAFS